MGYFFSLHFSVLWLISFTFWQTARRRLKHCLKGLINPKQSISQIHVIFRIYLGMSAFLKNITFHGILSDALFDAESEDLAVVARCLTQGIQSGTVRPLNLTVFGADDVEGAFRYMSTGKHIGKILIKVCAMSSCYQFDFTKTHFRFFVNGGQDFATSFHGNELRRPKIPLS